MSVLHKMKFARAAQHLQMTAIADLAAAELLHIHYGDGGHVFNLRYFYNQRGSTFVFEHEGVYIAEPYRIFSDCWQEYLHNQCPPQKSNLTTYRAEQEQVPFNGWPMDELRYPDSDTLMLMQYLCDASVRKIIDRHATS